MLSFPEIERRIRQARAAVTSNVPDARALTDEARAFFTQAVDCALLSESEEVRLREMQISESEELLDPRFENLFSVYAKQYKALTKVHSRKSLERYLREESDENKRKAAFENFHLGLNSPETMQTILAILHTRGLNFLDRNTENIEQMISRVAEVLIPRLKKFENVPPWNAFRGLHDSAYAPLQAYMTAAFGLLSNKFALQFRRAQAPTYHPDVEVYELREGNGAIVGFLHFDLFRREGKYKGAWTQTALTRRRLSDGNTQTPLVFLGFDFQNKNIHFAESRSFLHEIGHALEHCLNKNSDYDRSGLNGLTAEVMEVSSIYVEALNTHPSLLAQFNAPAATLIESRETQSVLDLTLITLLAQIDLEMHRRTFTNAADLNALVSEVSQTLGISHPLISPHYLTVFDHAFADNNYASRFYTYLLGFAYAQGLRQLENTSDFWNFWHKLGPPLRDTLPLQKISVEKILEAKY